jgi:multisubunit Na+/H+ antiporter MnhF subunit
MLNIYLILVLLFSAITICGVFLQKDIFSQILFLNTGTSLAALFICFLASFKVNNSYIDIALIYFLLSVVATNAYLKYFMQKHKKEEMKHVTK